MTYDFPATIGAAAVGSGILIPALGVATLTAAGFTTGGVAVGQYTSIGIFRR